MKPIALLLFGIFVLMVSIGAGIPIGERCGVCANPGGDATHYSTISGPIDVPIQIYYNAYNLSYLRQPLTEDQFKRDIEEAARGWNLVSPIKLFKNDTIKTTERIGDSNKFIIGVWRSNETNWIANANAWGPGWRGVKLNTNAMHLDNLKMQALVNSYLSVNLKNTLMHEFGHLILLGHWYGNYEDIDHQEIMSWGGSLICPGKGDRAGIAYNYAQGKYHPQETRMVLMRAIDAMALPNCPFTQAQFNIWVKTMGLNGARNKKVWVEIPAT